MGLVASATPPVIPTFIHGGPGKGEGSQASKGAHVAALTALSVNSIYSIFWPPQVQCLSGRQALELAVLTVKYS